MTTQVANVSRDVNMLATTPDRPRLWLDDAAFTTDDPRGLDANEVRNMLDAFHVVRGQSLVSWEGRDGQMRTADDGRFTPWINAETGRIYRHTKPGAELAQYTTLYDNLRAALSELTVRDLIIASAGAWDFGASAYVQFETPDGITGQSGMELKPFIGWTSSLDGSLAVNIGTGATSIICRNTFAHFTAEAAKSGYRVRQTKNSGDKITAAVMLEKLRLAWDAAENISATMDKLAEFSVTDATFSRFVETLYPDQEKGYASVVEKNRQLLSETYNGNPMAKQWRGTALGIIQAVNVAEQHYSAVRATVDDFTGQKTVPNVMMRNIRSWAKGDVDRVNDNALSVLNNVLKAQGKRQVALV